MTNADQNQLVAPGTTIRSFKDTSWQSILQLLEPEVDALDFTIMFRNMKAIEDTTELLLLDCRSGAFLSSISRQYGTHIYDALAVLGRTSTVVRLRASISSTYDKPDDVYRTLPRPGAPVARADDFEESAT